MPLLPRISTVSSQLGVVAFGNKAPRPSSVDLIETAKTAEDTQSSDGKGRSWVLSTRFGIAVLVSLGSAAMHALSVNVVMTMICMLNETAIDEAIDPNRDGLFLDEIQKVPIPNDTTRQCGRSKSDAIARVAIELGTVVWMPRIQGLVLSAFNFGLLAIVFTGWLADKANAKYLVGTSVLLAAVCNAMIPIASSLSSAGLVIFLRFVIGICDAAMQPTLNTLITRWFPADERNTILSIVTGGRQIGTLLILPVAGYLCSQRAIFDGWPAVFYLCTLTASIWCGLWSLLASDKPSKHSWISKEELEYLTNALKNESISSKRKHKKVPWCRIFSNTAVWATVASVICHEYPVKTLAFFLPLYIRDVLKFSVRDNGILSAVPVTCFFIMKLVSSAVADLVRRKFNLSKTLLAKIMNSIASAGLGAFLIGATFLDCTCPSLAIFCLSCGMGLAGLHTPGCIGTLVTIAPAYSGSITGMAYVLASTSAIVNVQLTKEIVVYNTRHEWGIVFILAGVIAFLPLIIFNMWGSADVQDFAKEKPSTVDCVPPSAGVPKANYPKIDVIVGYQNQPMS